jgi:nitric oxide reductase NorD protein
MTQLVIDEAFGTRLAAAMRHGLARLQERPNRHRLLLALTDRKPNDVDHYEGRYGCKGTRHCQL